MRTDHQLTWQVGAELGGTQRRIVLGETPGDPVMQVRKGDGVPAGSRQQDRHRLPGMVGAGGQQFAHQLDRHRGFAGTRITQDDQAATA